jgi:GAF domain-containing protein/HAMP domain-containing protein
MIDRFLRRLTVRRRIVGLFLISGLLLALSVPLIVANHTFLTNRLRQVTDVETHADRLLLLASTRIESSRVNLMRYAQDLAPSPYETLDDIDQAVQLLKEAQNLITSPHQKADVATVLDALTEYKTLVGDAEIARSEQQGQNISRLLFQAHRLGNDIGQRIEQIVSDSQNRVAAANKTVFTEARDRLIFLITGYVSMLVMVLILSTLIQRSITRPVSELQNAAEAFRLGYMDTAIPVAGTDELSLLAQTFNQMTAQLRDLISTLEQRVVERTRGLQAAADVAHATTSLLDPDTLLRQVVDLVRERFDLYYVGLFLLDKEPGDSGHTFAVLRAGTGEAGQKMLVRGHKLKMGGESMIGQCVAQSKARIALLALPLRSRGRVIGAMTVQSVAVNAFDEAYVAVLQTMADQIAVAIDNARLFANAQASLDEMETIHQRYLGQAWAKYTPARATTGYEQIGAEMSPLGHDTLPQVQLAVTEQRPVVWRDNENDEGPTKEPSPSTLIVPIVLRGQPIGALGFTETKGERQWSADDVTMVETIAEQLALAADNLRLLDETQRSAARERLVSELSEQMQRATDMEALMRITAEGLNEALSGSRAFVRMGMEAELAGGDESPPRVLAVAGHKSEKERQ